jgi:hypothetical protein
MKKTIAFLAALCAMALVACSNPATGEGPETGTISISVGGSPIARAIIGDPDDISNMAFELTLRGPGGTMSHVIPPANSPGSRALEIVAAVGAWTISVRAVGPLPGDPNGPAMTRGRGSDTVTVLSGQKATANIQITRGIEAADAEQLHAALHFGATAAASTDPLEPPTTIRLAGNISLAGFAWTPPPTAFIAVLEGNGHTISGLEGTGLFANIGADGEVRNFTLGVNIPYVASSNNVGGLTNWNSGLIEEVAVTGTVVGVTTVGGLVGTNMITGIVRNSEFNGASVTGDDNVGGIAGTNIGRVEVSRVSGNVGNANAWHVGGIAGVNSGTVTGSTVTGNVTGQNNVGGIVGSNAPPATPDGGIVEGSSFEGSTITGSNNVGGIAGLNEGMVSNDNIYDPAAVIIL